MHRYEIRAATPGDEEALLDVARHLDTVNLPADRDMISALLELSTRSFAAEIPPPHRKYVFVLIDRETGLVAGTSMVVGQLGRRDAPYIYVDVLEDEKYSKLVDRHFHHKLLRIGYSYDGPTEIGGLIVRPEYRRAPERLGLLVSYVRFLFIAARRDWFRDELLAELLPPLEDDGTSHLWEAFGRRFTGMSYAEADRRSSENKDFIRDLFPTGVVYATLFSPEARAVIGQVGAQTKGVERMLRRIGFRYADRVDPFDGGPHFVVATDDVTLVGATRRARVTAGAPSQSAARTLVARERDTDPRFVAVAADALVEGAGVRLDDATREHLEVRDGDEVLVLPLP